MLVFSCFSGQNSKFKGEPSVPKDAQKQDVDVSLDSLSHEYIPLTQLSLLPQNSCWETTRSREDEKVLLEGGGMWE